MRGYRRGTDVCPPEIPGIMKGEEKIFLRRQFSNETGKLATDNIPAYADWLERKLHQLLTKDCGEPIPDYSEWIKKLEP